MPRGSLRTVQHGVTRSIIIPSRAYPSNCFDRNIMAQHVEMGKGNICTKSFLMYDGGGSSSSSLIVDQTRVINSERSLTVTVRLQVLEYLRLLHFLAILPTHEKKKSWITLESKRLYFSFWFAQSTPFVVWVLCCDSSRSTNLACWAQYPKVKGTSWSLCFAVRTNCS